MELAATVLEGDSDDEGGAANLGDDQQDDDCAEDLHEEPGWGSNGGSTDPGFDVAEAAGDDDAFRPRSLSDAPVAALRRMKKKQRKLLADLDAGPPAPDAEAGDGDGARCGVETAADGEG